MGGCRCTFRECTNNSVNSPGKHFFHFPFKDNERCKKWALNSDKVSFLRLPWTQLRNKTVCEDHFIDSSFMNFKKERLVKTAIPTLYRNTDGRIIDIEVDNEQLASIEYSFNDTGNDRNTIDLPDSQPQKRTIHVNLSVNEGANADEDAFVLSDSNVEMLTSTPMQNATPTLINTNILNEPKSFILNETKPIILNDSKPIVLNRIGTKSVAKRFAVRNIQEKSGQPIKREYLTDENETTVLPIYKTLNKRIKSVDQLVTASRTYGKSNINNSILLADAQESNSLSPQITTDNELTDPMTVNILEKINHIEERDANKVDKSLYMQMMAEHAKQIEDLKKLLTDKLSDKKETQSQNMSSASSSTDVRHIRVEKGPAMTKVQLFNGIRKYLNPTMVAMLRMEMFGSSEREYRADEKQLSKELYNLNQNVYDYMRDEWRFRLPPKSDVEEWLKNPDDEETWELC